MGSMSETVVVDGICIACGRSMKHERCDALEDAALRLEAMGGNELYKRAYRKAAKTIRAMKILTDGPQILTDNAGQISSTSSRPVDA